MPSDRTERNGLHLCRTAGQLRSFRTADTSAVTLTRATSLQSHRLPPPSLLPAALESFYLSESSSPYLEIAPAFCGDGGDEEDCGTHMHSPSASVRPARLPE